MILRTRTVRTVFCVVLLALLATACQATAELTQVASATSVPEETTIAIQPEDAAGAAAEDAVIDEAADAASTRRQDSPPPADTGADSGGGVDLTLKRGDVDCDQDLQTLYSDVDFAAAHLVVDGNLGALCFGTMDDRLIQAWEVLATITPPGQLHDLGLFGGFVSAEAEEVTLAFVNSLDDEGSLYQMSINLDEAEFDPDELMLTMAHEFSHVFTSLSTQIDRKFAFPEECETWDNGEGCFREDSLMWEWITLFWGDDLVGQIDPYQSPTGVLGEARCLINPGFLGKYAASHPEEDFAESFSAFVFQLDVDTPQLDEKMQWFANQPGLVEFRDRAIRAGLGPLPNEFERCG